MAVIRFRTGHGHACVLLAAPTKVSRTTDRRIYRVYFAENARFDHCGTELIITRAEARRLRRQLTRLIDGRA